MLDSLINLRALTEAGGSLVSATENLDNIDTPQGKMSLGQLLLMAEWQLDLIRASWMDTHENRVDRKLPHSGTARYGYDYIDGMFSVNPVEGPLLRGMYMDYCDGASFLDIARKMNAQQWTGKAGAAWTHSSVRQVLDSGFGAGYFHFRGVKHLGMHKGVITTIEWDRYVLKRQANGALHPREIGAPAILKRLVYCEVCNRRMALCRRKQTKNGRLYEYAIWKCTGVPETGQATGCGSQTISNEALEYYVREWLQDQATQRMSGPVKTQLKAAARTAKRKIEDVERALRHQENRKKNLRLEWLDRNPDDPMAMSRTEYDDMGMEITTTIAQLESELALLRQDVQLVEMDRSAVYASIFAAWDEAPDVASMNAALTAVLSRLTIRRQVTGMRMSATPSPEEGAARITIVPKYDEPATQSATA